MAGMFAASVAKFADMSERRVEATFKAATQDLLEDANTPEGQGGRMRVDTGFLRNSLAASLNGIPVGPSEQGEAQGDPEAIALVLAGFDLGDTIVAGWTANYARPREVLDGFMESAVQKWQFYVDKAAADAARRIK